LRGVTEAIRLLRDEVATPLGRLVLVSDEEGRLYAAGWADRESRMNRYLSRLDATMGSKGLRITLASAPKVLSSGLRAYFDGDLSALDRLLVVSQGTKFQHAVWEALREIPCGETRSYSEIAKQIGRPRAVRAVGFANGSNPVAVVVPCHRVIGSNGSLTGYGGGLERKRWLLAHERTA
jgi:methylated-DNA-[protein]-cysteine S-methyltransferase